LSYQGENTAETEEREMRITAILRTALLFVAAACLLSGATDPAMTTIKGYVIDSACAFTKNLAKPISKECATSCAKSGSPLVILSDSGLVYWPISDTTPAVGQNDKLLPFAAQKVTVTGRMFSRGGSRAIVIEKIEPAGASK
jgi:hypothetical protein